MIFRVWKKEDRESRELIERDKLVVPYFSATFLKRWTSVTKVEDDLDFGRIPQNSHILRFPRGPELVWGSKTWSSDATWYGFLMKPKRVILDKRGVIPMANSRRWRECYTNSNSKVFTDFFSIGMISGESGVIRTEMRYSSPSVWPRILILFTTERKKW